MDKVTVLAIIGAILSTYGVLKVDRGFFPKICLTVGIVIIWRINYG